METIQLLKRRPWGIVGAVILLAVILLAVLAPIMATHQFNEINVDNRLQPPGGNFIMGTDNLGRDIFSRWLYGSRPYVGTALIAVGIAVIPGLLLGLLSARAGRKTDSILRRAVLIPVYLFLAVLLISVIARSLMILPILHVLGAGGPNLVITLTALLVSTVFLPSMYIVVRKAFFPAGKGRDVFRKLTPLWTVLPVSILVAVGIAVPVMAHLGYYGLGIPPPLPEWGNMLSGSGRQYMLTAPGMVIAPGISIVVTTVGLVLFGLALREIWFPRLAPPLTPAKKAE
ncbi:ABC transporter permease [Chloroflexota bacterium]